MISQELSVRPKQERTRVGSSWRVDRSGQRLEAGALEGASSKSVAVRRHRHRAIGFACRSLEKPSAFISQRPSSQPSDEEDVHVFHRELLSFLHGLCCCAREATGVNRVGESREKDNRERCVFNSESIRRLFSHLALALPLLLLLVLLLLPPYSP